MEYCVCESSNFWRFLGLIHWFAILRWYGVSFGLGKVNFVLRFFYIMFTLASPSFKTLSTMFFPTYIWIIAIWLSTSITAMSNLECVSTTMVTLGSNIYLVVILGFSGFNFCYIYL